MQKDIREAILDIKKIKGEINSEALSNLAEQIGDVYKRVRDQKIDTDQARSEIAALRSLLQIVALDWSFTKEQKSNPQQLTNI